MKSNINKRTILPGLLSLLLLVTACKKALDINQDPNNPSLRGKSAARISCSSHGYSGYGRR